MTNDTLSLAYQQCWDIARNHYENFPVASRFLPGRLRSATAVVYAFARRADDIVDEGVADAPTRRAQLQAMRTGLDRIARLQSSAEPLFIALADVIAKFSIPLQPFYDLLTAFTMDIDTHRYSQPADLLNYCAYSANPVGQIILHLHQQANPATLALSDKICTALQLVNFIQDIDSDYQQRRRIYIPEEELRACGVTETHFQTRNGDAAMRQMIGLQLVRARRLLAAGAPLAQHLHGQLRWEIRAIVASAWRMLDKLSARDDPFARPSLRTGDLLAILPLLVFYNARICNYQQHPAAA